MTQMKKYAKTQNITKKITQMRSFLQNHKKTETFSFCVITFESIEFQTRSAPQNERLNLSFVKDTYVDCGKLARNGRKTAICQSQILVISLYYTASSLVNLLVVLCPFR